MLHDEQLYPDPYSFSPERFLKDGQLDPNIKDPAEIAFGFGRRICPGRYMAKSTVWIGIASILATFTIEKATDDQGLVIEPLVEYSSGLSRYLPTHNPRSPDSLYLRLTLIIRNSAIRYRSNVSFGLVPRQQNLLFDLLSRMIDIISWQYTSLKKGKEYEPAIHHTELRHTSLYSLPIFLGVLTTRFQNQGILDSKIFLGAFFYFHSVLVCPCFKIAERDKQSPPGLHVNF